MGAAALLLLPPPLPKSGTSGVSGVSGFSGPRIGSSAGPDSLVPRVVSLPMEVPLPVVVVSSAPARPARPAAEELDEMPTGTPRFE